MVDDTVGRAEQPDGGPGGRPDRATRRRSPLPRHGLTRRAFLTTLAVVGVAGMIPIAVHILLEIGDSVPPTTAFANVTPFILAAAITTPALAALIAVMVHRLVADPLDAMARALEGVSAIPDDVGGAPIPASNRGRDDELGRLARDVDAILHGFAEALERERAAGLAIRARETHLRGVMDNIGEGIVTIDLENNIRSMNPAATRLFGYEPHEVEGLPLLRLLEIDDYHRFLTALAGSLDETDETGEVRRLELTAIRRDGTRVPASLTVRMMLVEGDESYICVVRDISIRKAAERAVRESEARLNLAVTATRSGVWDADLDAGTCWFSPEFVAMLGHHERGLAHRLGIWEGLVHPADRVWLMRLAEDFVAGAVSEFQPIYRLRHADGSWVWIEAKGHCARDERGRARRFIGTMADVTERKLHEEQVLFLANHDALTGLPNRAYLIERLEHAVSHSRRGDRHLAALVIDVDRFKLINDADGHAAGDEFLRRFAERVGGVMRVTDTFGRMGGDEFLVIAEDLAAPSEALAVADAIRRATREPFHVDGTPHFATLSIGIATHDGDPERRMDGPTLARHANAAMRVAKAEGGNNHRFFDREMDAEATARMELERELRAAIDGDQFVIHYQPKFAVSGLEIVGLEALVRWLHPRDGMIPPDRFIPLAEETGLIAAIGTLVQAMAIDQIAQWRERGLPALPIAVNVSARQLAGEDAGLPVLAMLERAAVAPHWLELEITESMMMSNLATITRAMGKLRDRGVRVSVDDFGTGHSSLAYLRQLPISTLKIDRSFIKDVGVDEDATTLAAAIISIGRQLGLTVVAEGIEDRLQLEFLRHHGCDQAQGYLLGRPMPVEELERRHLSGGSWIGAVVPDDEAAE